MGISEISKFDGKLSPTYFDLKILGRLIKPKALLLKAKLHPYLGIDFLMTSLGYSNNFKYLKGSTLLQ